MMPHDPLIPSEHKFLHLWQVVLASAWLVSDNVILDLFRRFTTFFPTVAGVDTLHLFPETHDVW